MPIINVQMLTGRTADQKKLLIHEIGETAKRVLGVLDEALRIILSEVAPEHWGIGSSSLAEIRTAGHPSLATGPKLD